MGMVHREAGDEGPRGHPQSKPEDYLISSQPDDLSTYGVDLSLV